MQEQLDIVLSYVVSSFDIINGDQYSWCNNNIAFPEWRIMEDLHHHLHVGSCTAHSTHLMHFPSVADTNGTLNAHVPSTDASTSAHICAATEIAHIMLSHDSVDHVPAVQERNQPMPRLLPQSLPLSQQATIFSSTSASPHGVPQDQWMQFTSEQPATKSADGPFECPVHPYVNSSCDNRTGMDMEEEQGGKLSPHLGRRHNSKNLVSERKRRMRLNNMLYSLRALVPNITKMNKASIVGDAVTYVQNLEKQLEDMKNEIRCLHECKQSVRGEVELSCDEAGKRMLHKIVEYYRFCFHTHLYSHTGSISRKSTKHTRCSKQSGVKLEDGCTLADHNTQKEFTLHLVLRLWCDQARRGNMVLEVFLKQLVLIIKQRQCY